MSVADDVSRVAASQLGYQESGGSTGHNGNITKYWKELDLDLQGQSWCAAFVSWVFKHAGHPLPAVDHQWGYSYCPDAVNYARKHGQLVPVQKARKGDIALFNWHGGSLAEHTGIVIGNSPGELHTIEGNTLPMDGGDQSNGGGVYQKFRSYQYVVAVWRPFPGKAQHDLPKWYHRVLEYPPSKLRDPGHVEHGFQAGNDVEAVQRKLGVKVDGKYGPITESHVKGFQKTHKLAVDGKVGPATARKLEEK